MYAGVRQRGRERESKHESLPLAVYDVTCELGEKKGKRKSCAVLKAHRELFVNSYVTNL